MNSTSESTTSTTSHSAAAIAASLTTCCWIQPRTGRNGRLRLTVMLLNGTRTNVGGRRSASQRICVRGPASRPNSLRSDRGTMMWCQTVSGELSSTDRFNATHSSKSGAKLFVITAMRVMTLFPTISGSSKSIAPTTEYSIADVDYAWQRQTLHATRRPPGDDLSSWSFMTGTNHNASEIFTVIPDH